MSEKNKVGEQKNSLGRRDFLFTLFGGIAAAMAGWVAGTFPKDETSEQDEQDERSISATETRISALETKIAELTKALEKTGVEQPLAQLEGEFNERVTFNKKELSVINPDGVLLNLVATHGGVGIRFYKDFGFGNEQDTNPWHMGWIEGIQGYQGLAILRDWRFTAALWDEDGKLLLGRLHPHPPANEPARARLHVRGTLDEVQAIIEASADQVADIFQVTSGGSTTHFAVNSSGNVVVGSSEQPQEVILYDTQDKNAYSLKVTNGELALARV
jgi:hypothetical protein